MTTLYTPTAFDEPTAAELTTFRPIWIRCTADQSLTSTTTLTNDAQISIAVAASVSYNVEADIFYTAKGGAGAGQFKCGWTGPTGATFEWSNIGLVVNGASSVSGTPTFDVSAITDSRSFGAATASTVHVRISGTLIVSTTAGNFRFQFAQAASDGTQATIRKTGSWVLLTQTA